MPAGAPPASGAWLPTCCSRDRTVACSREILDSDRQLTESALYFPDRRDPSDGARGAARERSRCPPQPAAAPGEVPPCSGLRIDRELPLHHLAEPHGDRHQRLVRSPRRGEPDLLPAREARDRLAPGAAELHRGIREPERRGAPRGLSPRQGRGGPDGGHPRPLRSRGRPCGPGGPQPGQPGAPQGAQSKSSPSIENPRWQDRRAGDGGARVGGGRPRRRPGDRALHPGRSAVAQPRLPRALRDRRRRTRLRSPPRRVCGKLSTRAIAGSVACWICWRSWVSSTRRFSW